MRRKDDIMAFTKKEGRKGSGRLEGKEREEGRKEEKRQSKRGS